MDFLQNLTQSAPRAFDVFFEVWQQGWFVFVPIVLTYMMYWYWIEYQTGEYVSNIKWVNLAISVPPDNEQSPKVMEEFFNALHAAHSRRNYKELFWQGSVQEWFSLEIVGIGGDVQFIIRTPDYFRDLVEAHLYAQFPSIEIKEVPDYVDLLPDNFKKAGYDIFGGEMILTAEDFYPIKQYMQFEHQMTQRIIDPIATVAEVLNKLKPGEMIWCQFLIRPILDDWSEKGKDFARELMGQEVGAPTPKVLEALAKAGDVAATPMVGAGPEAGYESFPSAAFLMPPNERRVIENVERNVSKLAYDFKNRLIYIGQPDNPTAWNKKQFNAIVGAFKQFNTFDMNGFKPDKRTMTRIDYFFKNLRLPGRQRRLLTGYKTRSFVMGTEHKVLNTESIATLFHIPDISVKAPRLPRIDAKKGSAPANLPINELGIASPS